MNDITMIVIMLNGAMIARNDMGDRTHFIAVHILLCNSRSSSTPPSYFSPFRHGSGDRVSCTENVSEKGTTIK